MGLGRGAFRKVGRHSCQLRYCLGLDHPPECPKCQRLQKRPENTVGHCSKCQRYQFIYQAPWRGFAQATFRHLGCVQCVDGAWCRDFALEGDGQCAFRAHRHEVGKCPG